MTSPLISLCMIVKNEEQVLDKCLNSIQQYVEEIIIVDTGSTDATVSIASKYTNQIYHFEWIDDFSAARNESLKYATGQWILILDADEYFEENEIQKLYKCLKEREPEQGLIYNLTITSILGEKNNYSTNEAPVGRVFGNRLGIQYSRPIHEQPVSSKGLELKSAALPIRLQHSGYTEETMQQKNKHHRNLEIFNKLEMQQGLSAYDHLQLGNQYSMMGEYDKALSHLNQAIQQPHSLGSAYKQVLFTTIQVLINQGSLARAFSFFEQHLVPFLEYPDILTIKGIILQNLGCIDEAKQAFHAAVEEAERRAIKELPTAIVSPDTALRLPLLQLAMLYDKEKNHAKTIYYYTKIIITNPKDILAIGKLLEVLTLHEQPDAIIQLLYRLLQPDKVKTVLLGKIAIAQGNAALASHYLRSDELTDLLKSHEKLTLHMLTKQPSKFYSTWIALNDSERTSPNVIKAFIVGCLAWDKREWIADLKLPDDSEYQQLLHWSYQFLNELTMPMLNHELSTDLLRYIYAMGQHSLFDQVMDHLADNATINNMANYFYEHHHLVEAEQYYQYLEDREALNTDSCVNLAGYSLQSNDRVAAQRYLERALHLSPSRKNLYVLYIKNCTDPDKADSARLQLFNLDQDYKDLSII